MSLPIALQLFTVRDVLNQDLDGGLQQVAGCGYQYVELAGTYGLEPQELKAKLDKFGLTPISAHIGLDALQDKLPETLKLAEVMGIDKMAVAYLNEKWRSIDGYTQAAKQLSNAAKQAADQSVRIGYHNHAFEFETQSDGRTGYQILTDETDAGVFFEMDIYWFVKGDQDPQRWMDKLEGRIPLLHMKDMDNTADRGFAEIGTGTIDLKAVASVAPQYGVQALIVEQDNNWANMDPMNSARVGYRNLSNMLG